ncbi:hypothetical protein [Paraburkholderia terrae]
MRSEVADAYRLATLAQLARRRAGEPCQRAELPRDQRRVRELARAEHAVTVTTAEDIGALTTEILLAEPCISRRVVHVAGETIGYGQLADKLDAFTGRTFERVQWTVPQLKRELALDLDNGLKKYRVVFAEGKGVAWDERQTFNAQRGIAVENVGQ